MSKKQNRFNIIERFGLLLAFILGLGIWVIAGFGAFYILKLFEIL